MVYHCTLWPRIRLRVQIPGRITHSSLEREEIPENQLHTCDHISLLIQLSREAPCYGMAFHESADQLIMCKKLTLCLTTHCLRILYKRFMPLLPHFMAQSSVWCLFDVNTNSFSFAPNPRQTQRVSLTTAPPREPSQRLPAQGDQSWLLPEF